MCLLLLLAGQFLRFYRLQSIGSRFSLRHEYSAYEIGVRTRTKIAPDPCRIGFGCGLPVLDCGGWMIVSGHSIRIMVVPDRQCDDDSSRILRAFGCLSIRIHCRTAQTLLVVVPHNTSHRTDWISLAVLVQDTHVRTFHFWGVSVYFVGVLNRGHSDQ